MSAPWYLTFAGGWCEAWADRGQVSVAGAAARWGERGEHVHLNLTPDGRTQWRDAHGSGKRSAGGESS